LTLPQDKVSSIEVNDVVLERKDGKFAVSGLKDGETQKDMELPAVVSAATVPAFDAVQGKGAEAQAKLEPADFQVTVKREGGDPVVYKFKKEEAGGAYLFTVSTQPYVFRVAESSVKALVGAKRETLVVVKQPEAPKPEPQAEQQPKPEEPKTAEPQATPVPPQLPSTGG
jgi:hypothetical protein